MHDVKDDIIHFWFTESNQDQWFQKDTDFDNQIRERFESAYHLGLGGAYDSWLSDAIGCLALIILYDQFPRNMFRETPQMFATDGKAREISRHLIENKFDQKMTLHQKVFSYLPFEHSEELEDQLESVKLFESLQSQGANFYDYAIRHYDVIKKFGRFPQHTRGRKIPYSTK